MRITQRAQRIEPFYVMEMAKAAQRIANEVKHTEHHRLPIERKAEA